MLFHVILKKENSHMLHINCTCWSLDPWSEMRPKKKNAPYVVLSKQHLDKLVVAKHKCAPLDLLSCSVSYIC